MNQKILKKIIEISSFDKRIKTLSDLSGNIPYHDDYNNIHDYWYPHPPCLIPLFLGYGASYKGFLLHFFNDRDITFIEYNLENGYFYEIAKNTDQLITLLILNMIIIKDEVSDDIVKFSMQLDFENLKEVDHFSLEYGDNPKDFDKLVFFNKEMPSKYIDKGYSNDYPSTLTSINESILKNSCSFEIINKKSLNDINDIPKWLQPTSNKKELFNTFISNNQFKEAWLTLNSHEWKLIDVVEGLNILKTKTDNQLFHLVADNWISGWQNSDAKEEDCY